MIDQTLAALRAYGPDRQIRKAAEEMAECAAALIRYLDDPSLDGPVHEELADVQIMVHQMRDYFGAEYVDDWIKIKTERLMKRIEERK